MRMVELCFAADYFHLHKTNFQDVTMQTGEIVMDICRIDVSSIGRS